MNTRNVLSITVLLLVIAAGCHDRGEPPALGGATSARVTAAAVTAGTVEARASDSNFRLASYPVDVPTLPPVADRFDDGEDLATGEGDASSYKDACDAAKNACRTQLKCARKKVEKGCTCSKGGEKGLVCRAECSCEPEPSA